MSNILKKSIGSTFDAKYVSYFVPSKNIQFFAPNEHCLLDCYSIFTVD